MDKKDFSNVMLIKYPKILARLLYKTDDTDYVINKVVQFAYTFDETEDLIPDIKKIISNVLLCDVWKWYDLNLRKKFDEIAFACVGANAGYYESNSTDSDEALLLWLSYLSSCALAEHYGTNSALHYMGGYALRSSDKHLLSLLASASYDFIIVYPWELFFETAFLHISVCVSSQIPSLIQQAVKMKLFLKNDIENFHCALYVLEDISKKLKGFRSLIGGQNGMEYGAIQKEFEDLSSWMKIINK